MDQVWRAWQTDIPGIEVPDSPDISFEKEKETHMMVATPDENKVQHLFCFIQAIARTITCFSCFS